MKKTLKIIAIVLFTLLVIFSIISFILWKEQTTYIFECIIDFINKPIVIAGVSTTIGGIFLFLISRYIFSNSKFGRKRLDELESKIEGLEEKQTHFIENIDNHISEMEERQDNTNSVLFKSLTLAKNIKIQALANELKGETYGEEETNCDKEEETL